MNEEFLIELLVEAILDDICRRTDEWADPTGEKACDIYDLQKKHVL